MTTLNITEELLTDVVGQMDEYRPYECTRNIQVGKRNVHYEYNSVGMKEISDYELQCKLEEWITKESVEFSAYFNAGHGWRCTSAYSGTVWYPTKLEALVDLYQKTKDNL